MKPFVKEEERKSSGKKTNNKEKEKIPEKFDGMVLDRNGNKKLLEPSPILTRRQASKASEDCESPNKGWRSLAAWSIVGLCLAIQRVPSSGQAKP